jgi:hypothetical protein
MNSIQREYLRNARKAIRIANDVKFNDVAYNHQVTQVCWVQAIQEPNGTAQGVLEPQGHCRCSSLSRHSLTPPQVLVGVCTGRVPCPRCFSLCDEHILIDPRHGPLRCCGSWTASARLPRLEAPVVDRVERRAANSRPTRDSLFIEFQTWIGPVK